jgi:heme exporter protein A
MLMKPLTAIDVTCRRGARVLFQGLSFELERGQLAWLRGRNGRGKTSLLRMAAGLLDVEHGRIHCDRRELVYLGHANALKDDLSASEALDFLLRMQGRRSTHAALHAALERLGLPGRHAAPVRTLSQGQRRRVALARLALDERPALWLLDEPFDALDADGSELLDALLQAHVRRGGSVLLCSHQAPRAAQFEVDLDRAAPA